MPGEERQKHAPTAGTPSLSQGAPTPSSEPDAGEARTFLSPGQVLNDRYWIRRLLGRGGMGEVWQALDLKLRVDVALKSLHPRFYADEGRRELLRQEVRAAREVISPNVCRVYDLVEVEDRELLSMEHIDGQTLLALLKERAPLPLIEGRDLALQFLTGLDAVHAAGLVHRDFKPENVMITRSGRVVVMDFGIAQKAEGGRGSVSGTPAYMSPEQSRGEAVDARTDLYAVGVVLAEMLSAAGVSDRTTRKSVWEAIHEDPPRIPDSPWAPVIRRAVAPNPHDRPESAQALVRSLQEITLRVEGAEDKRPYPGLASFTTRDAEHFFGREAEVETMARRLRRANLLALVGPSGAGKSSFLRAGLFPALPDGWAHIYCQPGEHPFTALAQALASELTEDTRKEPSASGEEDPQTILELVRRWRSGHEEALVILDQFEELFILNPGEVQAGFAELVGDLVSSADVRVLVSMRDDFLFHCQAHEPLSPLFSELTPLGPPTGAALHRALVQPALSLGYRFEDESLVTEMLEEVARERGALPLLAFAAAGLWERRDPDEGLLTRRAYEGIGGVEGALARHAEATLEKVGLEREPIVRELLRNLATAQGTRAARDRDELLSVFDDSSDAEEVLGELIAARLLTSFDVGRRGSTDATQRVEVIHESLFSAWPRLVRWRAQDAEGAYLRDQLRQAARAWHDRGRPEDLLWSGTSYREFELWRERYPGGLTANEESFAEAMTRHARRRRQRRRTAVASAFVFLVVVLAGVLGLWRRSEDARQQAVTEAQRAEASRLVMLGRLEMEDDPTVALAYTTKSLELADLPAAREQVMAALWRGPMRFVLSPVGTMDAVFSPDGRWLARWQSGPPERLEVWPSDGGPPVSFPGEGKATFRVAPDGALVMASLRPHQGGPTDILLRTPPEWSVRDQLSLRAWVDFPPEVQDSPALGFARIEPPGLRLFSWPLDGNPPVPTGVVEHSKVVLVTIVPNHTGTGIAYLGRDGRTYVSLRDEQGRVSVRPVGEGDAAGRAKVLSNVFDHPLGFDRQGRRLALAAGDGSIRIYAVPPRPGPPLRTLAPPPAPVQSFDFSPDGRWLVSESGEGRGAFLWDLTPPAEAEPTAIQLGEPMQANSVRFDPSGGWLAVAASQTSLLPVPVRHSRVIHAHQGKGTAVAFDPHGRFLVSASLDGSVRLWSLLNDAGRSSRPLFQDEGGGGVVDVDVDPAGENVLVGCQWGRVWVVPIDGSPPRLLEGNGGMSVAFGPEGRLAAATGGQGRVWDLEAGGVKVLDAGDGFLMGWWLEFTRDGRVLSSGRNGTVRLWNVATGTYEAFPRGGEGEIPPPGAGPDELTSVMTRGRLAKVVCTGRPDDRAHWSCRDLVSDRSWPLDGTAHGALANEFALDPSGRMLVSGDTLGNVRVGSVDGGPPHLLVGHEEPIRDLTVSADGRWIASIDSRGTLRLWPTPEGEPFHMLPREELITRLRALTNLRVIEDAGSASGYRLTHDPFPGWETVPTW
jgi:WD40 repeat protein